MDDATYHECLPLRPTIHIGATEIDILQSAVRAGTCTVHLTRLELSLLYLQVANAGRVVTRDEILNALWGVDYIPDNNVVDRHIRALRAKLSDVIHNSQLIATVPGEGYRFVPPLQGGE